MRRVNIKALEKRLDKLSKELCRLKAGGICAEPTLISELDRRVKIWSLPELQELEKEIKEQIKAFN